MSKKISKYGSEGIITIDKSILDSLKITEKTNLKVSTDGKSIIITPIKNKKTTISKDKKLQDLYEKNIKKYGTTLKKLSKH